MKGRMARIFEGEKVGYNNGAILADTVITSEYKNAYWSAQDIASTSEKWSWNISAQAISQLIHSTQPLRISRIDTAYGNYQTLEVEYAKPSLGTRMGIFVELAGGKPVKFVAPSRIIEVKFNSLGIEEASRTVNLLGGEIEATKSELDSLGRPNPVKDAQGKALSIKKPVKTATSGGIILIIIPIRFGRDLAWLRPPMNLTALPVYR